MRKKVRTLQNNTPSETQESAPTGGQTERHTNRDALVSEPMSARNNPSLKSVPVVATVSTAVLPPIKKIRRVRPHVHAKVHKRKKFSKLKFKGAS